MNNFIKVFFLTLVRQVLIIVGFSILFYMGNMWPGLELVITYSVYPVLFGILIISFRFYKYNITLLLFFLANMLLLIEVSQFHFLSLDKTFLFNGFTVLMIANIMLLSLFRRRQIRRKVILLIGMFFLCQVACLGFLAFLIQLKIVEIVTISVLPNAIIQFLPNVSQVVLLVFILGYCSLLVNRLLTEQQFSKIGLDMLVGIAVYQVYYFNQGMDLVVFLAILMGIVAINLFQDIYHHAYLDQLTQIPSRRALEEQANKLTSGYTVAMADIDFFKKFNDTYGHDVGDQVLAFIANILQKHCKGMTFRYGGEEFTLLFPKSSLKDSFDHLEELRQIVANSPFRLRKVDQHNNKNSTVKVTISIGVAEHSKKHNSFAQVLKAADLALYRAKKKGRNCVSK